MVNRRLTGVYAMYTCLFNFHFDILLFQINILWR